MLPSPPFDGGPFGVSERRIIAPPLGLYISPELRLGLESVTRLRYRPAVLETAVGVPDMGENENVVWWRGKLIEVPPTSVAANALTSRFTLDPTDRLLNSLGSGGAAAMAASTLYYVYMNPDGIIRASATVPVRSYGGVRILNTAHGARDWLFLGYVRTTSGTQYTDTTTDRLVVNWFNRRRKSILLRPGYVDDDSQTTYTHSSTVYAEVNAGTGATGSYIATGEDSVSFHVKYSMIPGASATMRCGIGDNSLTTVQAIGMSEVSAQASDGSVPLSFTPSEGYRTVSLLGVRLTANGTFRADLIRAGSATDPALTYLTGEVTT